MISNVTKEIGGETYTFCLKNKAKRKADQFLKANGESSLIFIIQDMKSRISHQFITALIAASANNGNGMSMDDADDLLDTIDDDGEIGALVVDIVMAAFPDAEKEEAEATGKNSKRAIQKK